MAAGTMHARCPDATVLPRRTRTDVIERLFDGGRLTECQVHAAWEIRRLWEALSAGLAPRARSLIRAKQSGAGRSLDPMARLTDVEFAVYRRRYKPWASQAAVRYAKGRSGGTWLGLTVDVVVDNAPMRALERKYGLRNGTARLVLRRSLQLYVETAGWEVSQRRGSL